jgi:hypothetical protein
MRATRFTPRSLTMVCFLALAMSACQSDSPSPVSPQADVARSDGRESHAFKLYTQNMYLGGDTGPLFTIDFSDIGAVLAATNRFWADVQASDIPARAATRSMPSGRTSSRCRRHCAS